MGPAKAVNPRELPPPLLSPSSGLLPPLSSNAPASSLGDCCITTRPLFPRVATFLEETLQTAKHNWKHRLLRSSRLRLGEHFIDKCLKSQRCDLHGCSGGDLGLD